MNNTELEEKLFSDHCIRDIVGGVYASDALSIHAKKRPLLHIVNTDPSYRKTLAGDLYWRRRICRIL